MDEVLALCADQPLRSLAVGETLIEADQPGSALYVLVDGVVEVRRGEVTVTRVTEPGSFLGEIAALLDSPSSADVVAVEPATVRVIDDPAATIAREPELALAIARLLARRLRAITTYLVDLKTQYADAGGHLAVMDQVLSELMTTRPRSAAPGSERDDVPDY